MKYSVNKAILLALILLLPLPLFFPLYKPFRSYTYEQLTSDISELNKSGQIVKDGQMLEKYFA